MNHTDARPFDMGLALKETWRLMIKKPLHVFVWGLLLTLPSVPVFLVMYGVMGNLTLDQLGNENDPAMQSVAMQINMVSWAVQIVALGAMVLVSKAINEQIIRSDSTHAWFGLKPDMQAVRSFVVLLALWIGFAIAIFLIALIAVLIGAALAAVSGQIVGVLVGILIGVLGLVGLIWAAIKTSLILAASVGLRDFAFVQGWQATKGHFWPLLGLGVIVALLYIAVALVMYFIGFVVIIAAVFAMHGSLDSGLPINEIIGWGGVIGLCIAYALFAAIFSGIAYVLAFGPFASAWRQMALRAANASAFVPTTAPTL